MRLTGRLQQLYRTSCEERTRTREKLAQVLHGVARIEAFQADFFKKPLETLLACVEEAAKVLQQLAVIRRSYQDLVQKLLVDIAMVEEEKQQIVALLQEYVREVHAQMGKIDSNSSIPVRGRPIKMLRLEIPDWDENEDAYRARIEEKVGALAKRGIELLEDEDSLHEFIGRRLTTKALYDDVVGIANVRIELFKIEAQHERRITWREVASNSGGEGFLSAFVILASLLHYMRRDETDIFAERNEGKVLLMDNRLASLETFDGSGEEEQHAARMPDGAGGRIHLQSFRQYLCAQSRRIKAEPPPIPEEPPARRKDARHGALLRADRGERRRGADGTAVLNGRKEAAEARVSPSLCRRRDSGRMSFFFRRCEQPGRRCEHP